MKVLSWVLLAVGCYGAVACLVASGLLGAIFSGNALLTPWDLQAQVNWVQQLAGTVAARWPWVAGMFACFFFAMLGAHLQMRGGPAPGPR